MIVARRPVVATGRDTRGASGACTVAVRFAGVTGRELLTLGETTEWVASNALTARLTDGIGAGLGATANGRGDDAPEASVTA